MSRYTVTVTPDDPRGGPKTVARVDTSSGTPLVTELVVTAADGGSLPARPLPLLDIIAAVAALAPSAAEVSAAAARASATVTTTGPRKRGGRAAGESGVAKAGAARAARSGAARSGSAKATKARSAEPTMVRAEATKPTRTRSSPPKLADAAGRREQTTMRAEPTAATPGSAARGETARVYRRMPDPAELVAAFRKAGSVRDLVQQYDVPRHTMNGWLARLRQQGLLERRQAR